MDKLIEQATAEGVSPFDLIVRTREDGTEYWTGRDLCAHLGYAENQSGWQGFKRSVMRAERAIQGESVFAGQGHCMTDHTVTPGDMIEHIVPATARRARGRHGTQEVSDFHLTRYGAYVVTLHAGDGVKHGEKIAAAKDYFAVSTRQAELLRDAGAVEMVAEATGETYDLASVSENMRRDVSDYRAVRDWRKGVSPIDLGIILTGHAGGRIAGADVREALFSMGAIRRTEGAGKWVPAKTATGQRFVQRNPNNHISLTEAGIQAVAAYMGIGPVALMYANVVD